jgi:site-specific recombinase XerD
VKAKPFPLTVKRGSATVKIYKTPCRGKIRYTISYWLDGTRKRQTFDDLDRAKTEAASAANQLTSGDLDVLELTGADRAAYLRARQLLDPLGLGIEAAAAELADARKRLGGLSLAHAVESYVRRHQGIVAGKQIAEVVQELLAAKGTDNLSLRYLRQLQYDLSAFEKKFAGRIAAVTGAEIDGWLRELGVAPRTRNNVRTSIGTLFTFAKGRKYLPKDHDELEAVPVAKDNDGEIEIFTPAELRELLAVARPGMIPFLAVGAFAGVRHAELQRLDWSNLKRDGDVIEIRAAKANTASRRVIPILPNLRVWLEPYWQSSGAVCDYLDMSKKFAELTKRVNERRRVAGIAECGSANGDGAGGGIGKSGAVESREDGPGTDRLDGGRDDGAEGKFKWKHNALRHSFISYRVAETQNVAQVALEAGNSPQMIFQHYRELVRPAEAKAWFAIIPGGKS